MSPYTHKTIISLAALAVLIVGYLVFSTNTTPLRADTASELPDTPEPVGQDILDLLTSFRSVSIDASIFASPLFQSLHDFSSVLPAQVQGRANPFAPIAGQAVTPSDISKVTIKR